MSPSIFHLSFSTPTIQSSPEKTIIIFIYQHDNSQEICHPLIETTNGVNFCSVHVSASASAAASRHRKQAIANRRCLVQAIAPEAIQGPVVVVEARGEISDEGFSEGEGGDWLTATALTGSMIVPDAAEAAVSPSLKNGLLSIGPGGGEEGVVPAALAGAVIGVASFDPVKEGLRKH